MKYSKITVITTPFLFSIIISDWPCFMNPCSTYNHVGPFIIDVALLTHHYPTNLPIQCGWYPSIQKDPAQKKIMSAQATADLWLLCAFLANQT